MYAILKNKWVKLSALAIVLVILGVLANYYLFQQMAVVVAFNPNVQESDALQTLSKYKSGIETRTPPEYDHYFFEAMLSPFSQSHAIEFADCRLCAYLIKGSIASEPNVHGVVVVNLPDKLSEAFFKDAINGTLPPPPKTN